MNHIRSLKTCSKEADAVDYRKMQKCNIQSIARTHFSQIDRTRRISVVSELLYYQHLAPAVSLLLLLYTSIVSHITLL